LRLADHLEVCSSSVSEVDAPLTNTYGPSDTTPTASVWVQETPVIRCQLALKLSETGAYGGLFSSPKSGIGGSQSVCTEFILPRDVGSLAIV
jgi:hypothetical protein